MIKLWNIQRGGNRGHSQDTQTSADGRYIVSGSYDKKENSGIYKNGGKSANLPDIRTPLDQWL